jgi:hypothetical protein
MTFKSCKDCIGRTIILSPATRVKVGVLMCVLVLIWQLLDETALAFLLFMRDSLQSGFGLCLKRIKNRTIDMAQRGCMRPDVSIMSRCISGSGVAGYKCRHEPHRLSYVFRISFLSLLLM